MIEANLLNILKSPDLESVILALNLLKESDFTPSKQEKYLLQIFRRKGEEQIRIHLNGHHFIFLTPNHIRVDEDIMDIDESTWDKLNTFLTNLKSQTIYSKIQSL